MKKIYLLFVVALVMFTQGLASAQGVLTFEKETHDFGNIPEGPVASHEFVVKNTGNQPVVISNVQPSCGCTTPEWSKDPILPGKTAIIKAGYNTAGRPGAFNKALTISSNAEPSTQMLFIKGTVTVKPAAPAPTPQEVANSAKLELTTTAFDFGKVEKGQKVTAKFTVKNTGKQDLNVTGLQSSCNCVVHKMSPSVIKPGQSSKLELIYTPQLLQNRIETVTLASNDITGSAATITLKANVVESLAKQSAVKVNKAAVPFK
ncbi:MAG: DUF1573 domain-containing protein [Rufibacter sp.]